MIGRAFICQLVAKCFNIFKLHLIPERALSHVNRVNKSTRSSSPLWPLFFLDFLLIIQAIVYYPLDLVFWARQIKNVPGTRPAIPAIPTGIGIEWVVDGSIFAYFLPM